MMKNGIEHLFNGKVITVFSASNYCGYNSNKSGVLEISASGKTKDVIFNQGRYVSRKAVFFYDLDTPEPQLQTPTKEEYKPRDYTYNMPRYNTFQTPPKLPSPKKPLSPQIFGKSKSNQVLKERLPSLPKPMSLPTRSSSPFKPKVRSSSAALPLPPNKGFTPQKPTRLRRSSLKL